MRILATTDLHMQITPFDYFRGVPSDRFGLARTATLIRAARAEAPNALLVDNGDFMTGNPDSVCLIAENAISRKGSTRVHPAIEVMHALGYDAAALGNHDFDHGLAFTRSVVAGARFPILCANALRTRSPAPVEDECLFKPFTLLEREFLDETGARRRLRIGVIGLLPPRSVPQYRSNPFPILTRDIVETARAWVPLVRASGADVVLLLAHSGIGTRAHRSGMENAVIPLSRVEGIDAIVAGHSHQVFPDPVASADAKTKYGEINGVPVVCPGYWGSHLGLIDLTLEQDGGRWRVVHQQASLRPVSWHSPEGSSIAVAAPDPMVTRLFQPIHRHTLKQIRRPVGWTRAPLNSFFALVTPSSAVALVQRAQAWFLRERMAGFDPQDLPVLSSACPYKCGGLGGPGYYTDVAPGELTHLSVADLYPFPNNLGTINLTGRELRDWLERAASVFNRVTPGSSAQCLKAHETPAYYFETVLGLDYEIDLSQPARYTPEGQILDASATRVMNIRHRGRRLDDGQCFTLITNSYRLGGGGRYPGIDPERPLPDLSVSMHEVIVDYLAHHPDLDPHPPPHWRFRPLPGTQVRFRTSPSARKQGRETTKLRLTSQNEDAEGFLRFALAL